MILDIYSGAEKELDQPWCIRHGDMQWSPSGKQILSLSIYLTNPKAKKIDIPSPPELLPAFDKAKWTPTNGPFGGYMDAYAISPKDENVVYAAIGGNLYVTKDSGENWRILRNKNSLRFRDIGFGAEETGVLYGLGGGHLVRSDDGGETWEIFGPRDEIKNLEAIAPHPKTPGVVLALLSDEKTIVLYDKDSVRTLGVIEDKIGYEKLVIDRNNPDLVIEKDSYKLHVFSIDGGKTWKKVEPPKGEKSVSFIAGDKSNKSIIYAETGSGRVFYSDDGGNSWDIYANPKDDALWTDKIQETVSQLFPVQADVKQGEILEGYNIGQEMLAKSSPSNCKRVYMPVNREGLFRSDDGGTTWKSANNGLGRKAVYAISAFPDKTGEVVIQGEYELMTTHNGGETWDNALSGIGGNIFFGIHPITKGFALAADGQIGLHRSTDYGKTWECVVNEMRYSSTGTGRCFGFDIGKPEHITLYAMSGILESYDNGKTWKITAEYDSQFTDVLGTINMINIFTSGDRRNFQSSDKGKTWRVLDIPISMSEIAVLGRSDNPSAIYVLYPKFDPRQSFAALLVSKDCGDTWEARPLPKSIERPSAMARNPLNEDMLAVGFDEIDGVWLSMDDGKSWRKIGTGLPQRTKEELNKIRTIGYTPRQVKHLAFSPADNRLYVNIATEGLYWIELPKPEDLVDNQ